MPLLEGAGFVHAFGTRDTGPDRARARELIKEALPEVKAVATVKQVHGAAAVFLDRERDPEGLGETEADIIVTSRPGIAAAVRTADCAPALILDPVKKVAAAVHAGWKGTSLAGAARAVNILAEEYGSAPSTLLAGIGPCIGPCHYQVDAPVIVAIEEALGRRAELVLAPDGPDHARLDLSLANRLILEDAGVPPDRIEEARTCTFCESGTFFSYRREGQGVPSLHHLVAPL